LLRLLPWVLQHLKPRLLVVKSEELAEAAERQLLLQQTQQEQQVPQQLPTQALQLQQDMQQLQEQLQTATTLAGTAAGQGIVAAAALCVYESSSPSTDVAAGSCQQPYAQDLQQQQQQQSATAAAAAGGQIPNPQAWWDWLEVQCGLNPLLHSGCAEPWFLDARAKGFVRNPLRYPQRFTSDGTRICRPHNYDKCLKIATCGFDHQHCHHCGAAGHRAVDCHIVT
jgi:hypothetical protein